MISQLLMKTLLSSSQHFKLLVDELHVKGEAKIKNAMKESFKILNEVRGQHLQNDQCKSV